MIKLKSIIELSLANFDKEFGLPFSEHDANIAATQFREHFREWIYAFAADVALEAVAACELKEKELSREQHPDVRFQREEYGKTQWNEAVKAQLKAAKQFLGMS